METTHRVVAGDARSMDELPDDSVELVVTSPPYPMIEMWDEQFASLDPDVGDHLDDEDGPAAFAAMHDLLDAVWTEVGRVLVDGGIACINIADATRSLDGSFRVYPNHARVVEAFDERGFEPLPEILWRKPTNAATKFMGSGMVPPNAYVTLEHEYVLVFRNGGSTRSFETGSPRRYESAYFWEERNRWFSDVWTDVTGERQPLESAARGDDGDVRERSGAYPFAVPYRLVNMYSVYGDAVLDPFLGTGTTTVAAMVAGRNSVGYEIEPEFAAVLDRRVADVARVSRRVVEDRLRDHREFVAERRARDEPPAYDAAYYDVPVTTRQERDIRFYAVAAVDADDGVYVADHEPVTDEATSRGTDREPPDGPADPSDESADPSGG